MDACTSIYSCINDELYYLFVSAVYSVPSSILLRSTDFSCDVVNICHVNAECVHDDLEMRSVCRCLSSFVGDGLVCTPEGTLQCL